MIRLVFLTLFFMSTQAVAEDYSVRIIGGGPSDEGEWPTMVQLFKGDINASDEKSATYFCGGTLISNRWVLTAAHCFYDERGNVDTTAPDMFVIVKSQGLLRQGTRIEVDAIITHENYQSDHALNEYDSDIALLELGDNVSDPILQRIYFGTPSADCMAQIVGWGATSSDTASQASTQLKDAEVPIVSQSTCEKVMGESITGNMLCAGFTAGGTDTCAGDSGGPIFLQQEGEFRQVGITSWGSSFCGSANSYGVYTRLSEFTDWIMVTTRGLSHMVTQSGEACTPADNPNPEPEPNTSGGGGSLGWGMMASLLLLLFRRKG